jgi:hypothetical protein
VFILCALRLPNNGVNYIHRRVILCGR